MRIGVFFEPLDIDGAVATASAMADRGIASLWCPQIFRGDTLTTLAVIAREVPEIGLGTAVVPTYPRHPMVMAAQARVVQEVSGGRLTLGIGLSHQLVIEGMLGMSFDRPLRHMREYLDILVPLLHGDAVSVSGSTLTFHGTIDHPSEPVPLVVAALGTKMLQLAGRQADGTVTWMVGVDTVRDHIVPTIRAAAESAGRNEPRVVVALPVAVTDDPASARERAAKVFEIYGHLPSYRAMLDREGAAGPADVVIAGEERYVRDRIAAIEAAGATEFVGVPFNDDGPTLDLLAGLATGG